ncbi:hypothetical protein BX661DRAFT_69959 [Kickxella alabastrina]|uniref:uncharacterized protein n=1 Tax=Kickxella alabastrina TaxID=61397 RepID=UPI00221ECF67|nr:uncharacterized protein BX661DRAFT_69959 [Kickxella alabastrina]KAI7820760.1 hypothetical protein BX661DRAFT_69959 [Kickxella alabastrina]
MLCAVDTNHSTLANEKRLYLNTIGNINLCMFALLFVFLFANCCCAFGKKVCVNMQDLCCLILPHLHFVNYFSMCVVYFSISIFFMHKIAIQ